MRTGHCPRGQLLEAEDWSGDQGVPQVEDLPQEEGEFSLECLNTVHFTQYTGKHTSIGQYIFYLSESSDPKRKKTSGHVLCLFGYAYFVFAL